MDRGAVFPPVTAFYDGSHYWLADGFHRLSAALELDYVKITADIRQGTRRDAVLYSIGANATHGLSRTNADKRRAVERMLHDEEWRGWSDREIARRCAVSNRFVSNLRVGASVNGSQVADVSSLAPPKRRYIRNGRTHDQRAKSNGRQSHSVDAKDYEGRIRRAFNKTDDKGRAAMIERLRQLLCELENSHNDRG